MSTTPRDLEDDHLKEVEKRIESHLEWLAAKETITKDDLESLRQDLPTEPMLAEAIQVALPYPWSDLFEYVEASENQPAYWRTSHDRSAMRSAADREHKKTFAKAARDSRDITGTVERHGREIPASAAHVADAVASERYGSDDATDAGERALDRLRELLGGHQ